MGVGGGGWGGGWGGGHVCPCLANQGGRKFTCPTSYTAQQQPSSSPPACTPAKAHKAETLGQAVPVPHRHRCRGDAWVAQAKVGLQLSGGHGIAQVGNQQGKLALHCRPLRRLRLLRWWFLLLLWLLLLLQLLLLLRLLLGRVLLRL